MSINKNKGFTLIELLVVISIITLLSSIALFSVTKAREKAHLAVLAQDAHAIETQVDITRDMFGKTVGELTGNYCSGCWYGNSDLKNNSSLWFVTQSWAQLGFKVPPIDPWGQEFILQEKEEFGGDPNNCSLHDQVYSAGPDGFLQSDVFSVHSTAGPGVIVPGLGDDYVFGLTFYTCKQ